MKQITLLMMLFVASIGLNAQTIIIDENFVGKADNASVMDLTIAVGDHSPFLASDIERYKFAASSYTVQSEAAELISRSAAKGRQGLKFIKGILKFESDKRYTFSAIVKSASAGVEVQNLIRLQTNAPTDVVKDNINNKELADDWTTITSILDVVNAAGMKTQIQFEINSTVNGQTVYVKSWKITVEDTPQLSNEEVTKDDTQLSIYPNPVANFLTIKTVSKVQSVEIYNITGQVVMYSTEATLNTASLSKGAYIVKVAQENGLVSTKRFIKE